MESRPLTAPGSIPVTATGTSGSVAATATEPSAQTPTPSTKWGALGVTVALGLGSAFVVNRLSPPTSPGHALMRCAISLIPAALYYFNKLPDPTASCVTRQRTPEHFCVNDQSELPRLVDLLEQGVKLSRIMTLYSIAWLNHPNSVSFGDSELKTAAAALSPDKDFLAGVVTAARKFGWHTCPIPGSGVKHNGEDYAGTPATDPDVSFHALVQGSGKAMPPLPLGQLDVGDVLLIMQTRNVRGRQIIETQAIERQGSDEFQLFLPELGRYPHMSVDEIQLHIKQADDSPSRDQLMMIRLKKSDGL